MKERDEIMLKTIGAHIKEYTKASIATPVFMILEVIMETIIPLLMASIVNDGVEKGDTRHIYVTGAWMVAAALFSLFCGCMGAKYGAKASMGLGKNLRKAMFAQIQTYSFANIDKFSTAGLVTRLTTDVTNIQNAYQMILRMAMRAPSTIICAMVMSFFVSPRLASIYLAAVIFLGTALVVIATFAMRYFGRAFEKYDELNESVQENVSAIRVVKAYVREEHLSCIYKSRKSCRIKRPADDVYRICLHPSGQLVRRAYGRRKHTGNRRPDAFTDLLHEHPDESYDTLHDFRYDFHVCGKCETNL